MNDRFLDFAEEWMTTNGSDTWSLKNFHLNKSSLVDCLELIKEDIITKDLDGACQHLDELIAFWRKNSPNPMKSMMELSKKIGDLKEELEKANNRNLLFE